MASSTEAGWTQSSQNTSSWITPDSNNQSLADSSSDCTIIGFNDTIPWNQPQNLISLSTERLVDQLKNVIFLPIMLLIGAPSNVINMAVFYQQGLKDRINMCLFALAVADVLNVIFWIGLYAETMFTQFTDNAQLSPSFRFFISSNAVGLVGLMYAPPVLSAIIATERCVCVLFPLRARRCVPTKIMTVGILVLVIPVVFLQFVVTARYRITCVHEVFTGRTTWQIGAKFINQLHKTVLTALNGVLYGFIIAVGCPVVVFSATTITAIKLSQVVKWRKQAASSSSSTAMSSKEVGMTKMLICLAVEFFVLSIPGVVLRIWPMFQEEVRPGGLYTNTYGTLISLNQLCVFTSSSVNFFVYYSTGTKFRRTFQAMARRSPLNGGGQDGASSKDTGSQSASVVSLVAAAGHTTDTS